MKKSLLLSFALLVIIGSLLTACAGTASASLDGNWTLISYGSSSNPTPAVADTDASLTFDKDGQLSGNVGCNGFGGEYKVDGNAITFGPIMSTMMYCTEPIMQQEGTTLAVLVETVTFKLDGDQLTITSADGNSVLVLARK